MDRNAISTDKTTPIKMNDVNETISPNMYDNERQFRSIVTMPVPNR